MSALEKAIVENDLLPEKDYPNQKILWLIGELFPHTKAIEKPETSVAAADLGSEQKLNEVGFAIQQQQQNVNPQVTGNQDGSIVIAFQAAKEVLIWEIFGIF